jgi:hypothetical protein
MKILKTARRAVKASKTEEGMLNCQVGRGEKLRLSESLMDPEESQIQQWVLMQVGSMDLKICQGGSGSIPH